MKSMKILIIDDDPDSLAVAKLRLKKDGHILITSPSGEEGLQAAAAEHPDLILLDVQMPGKSGFRSAKS